MNIDLHSHSTVSDGTLTPTELVKRARRCGVDMLALTDHDSVAGLDEAQQAAAEQGLHLIDGVEISVTWNNTTVHVLGLNVDRRDERLRAGLARLCEYRQHRAKAIGRKLEQDGIPGAYKGASALANGVLVGRSHFARFLVERGYASDVREVFRKYLVKGKPGHVPGRWASLEEALRWINAAGGVAVIAHPARYKMTRSKLRRLLQEFKQMGGVGLEVVSSSHSKDECLTMARHARDFDLLASAGSDFHDPANPWVELGALAELPPGCTPIWKQLN